MSRVSLPGLSLSAAVVAAALLALLVLETGGDEPGQYRSLPESDAIMIAIRYIIVMSASVT